MITLNNIHPLTDFKRHAKDFIERIKATKSPLVLTVNGKAEVVVHEAQAFQELLDRLASAEAELRTMKLAALRQDIALGVEQINNGQYSEYSDESLPTLAADIKAAGRKQMSTDGAA